MSRISVLLASSLLLAVPGCGGGAAPAPATAQPAPEVRGSSDSAVDDCIAVFTRMRGCSDEYLAALVDLRVRLDVPAGIAVADRDQGRPALLAQAKAEWAIDSTDEAIASTCRGIVDGLDPAAVDGFRADAAQCLGAADCTGAVACVIAGTERHLQAQK